MKSSTVLTDPDAIKLVTGFMQSPGCSCSQDFRIGWLIGQSVLGRYPKSGYIPLEDVECRDGYSIHDNKGGYDDQDELQLCDWKYASVKGQSRR